MSVTAQVPVTELTDSSVSIDDRRSAPRMQRPLEAQLRPLGLTEAHRCEVEDISEGGLFVFVPLSYGLNVGQRCEIAFSMSPTAVSPDETCYATVVRTEIISSESPRKLGAGLRFDQPLFF